jgi:hypothetical protein
MMKHVSKKIVFISCLIFSSINACHAGTSLLTFLTDVSYGVDVDYDSDVPSAVLHNSVMQDVFSNLVGNETPANIVAIRKAHVAGFHKDAGGFKYFLFDGDFEYGGSPIYHNDIIRCINSSCSTYAIYMAGNSAALRDVRIDAFTLDPANGDVIFSIETAAMINSQLFYPADLVRFSQTTGLYSLELDSLIGFGGGAVLSLNRNIDAVMLMPNGYYLFSFSNAGSIDTSAGTLNYRKNDILYYKLGVTASSLGLAYTPEHFASAQNKVNLSSLMANMVDDIIFRDGFD